MSIQDQGWEIEEGAYRTGGLCLRVWTQEGPWGTLSVNVGIPLEEDEFVLNHDLNYDKGSLVLRAIIESGTISDTGKRVSYGFVKNQPVYRLNR